jgi:hypothetical protein
MRKGGNESTEKTQLDDDFHGDSEGIWWVSFLFPVNEDILDECRSSSRGGP